MSRVLLRPLARLDVEDVDRMLGKRYGLNARGQDPVVVRVVAFDEHGYATLRAENAAPRLQRVEAVTLAAAVDAGVLVEL